MHHVWQATNFFTAIIRSLPLASLHIFVNLALYIHSSSQLGHIGTLASEMEGCVFSQCTCVLTHLPAGIAAANDDTRLVVGTLCART